jgi:hypothetical protein
MQMKIRWFITLVVTAALITTFAVAAENKGAQQIQIDGGSRGNVPFPHRAHQDRLKDCNICHAVFPQEAGGLGKLKAGGQLKPKDVMNKQCIKCHRAEKNAGNASGPTTCSKCHIK